MIYHIPLPTAHCKQEGNLTARHLNDYLTPTYCDIIHWERKQNFLSCYVYRNRRNLSGFTALFTPVCFMPSSYCISYSHSTVSSTASILQN